MPGRGTELRREPQGSELATDFHHSGCSRSGLGRIEYQRPFNPVHDALDDRRTAVEGNLTATLRPRAGVEGVKRFCSATIRPVANAISRTSSCFTAIHSTACARFRTLTGTSPASTPVCRMEKAAAQSRPLPIGHTLVHQRPVCEDAATVRSIHA